MFKKLFSKKNFSRPQPMPYDKDMKAVDISFIPVEKRTDKIKSIHNVNFLNPYILLKQPYYTDVILESKEFSENFYRIEDILKEFADKEFTSGDKAVAKSVFEYLVSIDTKLSPFREKLLIMYKQEGDEKGFSYIIDNLKSQMKEKDNFHHENKKIEKILKKYDK